MRRPTGPASALGALAAAVLAVACCGSSTATLLGGDPAGYLITRDQLTSPDFTTYQPVVPVGAGWLDAGSAGALEKDGFERAAEVEYYRQVALGTSNGPITLTVAVALFASVPGAAAARTDLDRALDARSGAVSLSTGSLGDGGAATTVGGNLDGVPVIEISVVWRERNLVNSLVAEGRLGGLQLSQILPLAATQTAGELRRE